jgi:glycopeptide antibiotics resistance protein
MRKRRYKRALGICIGLYILFTIWVIILKMPFSIEHIHFYKEPRINLIPFHYLYKDNSTGLEILFNIFFFIPYGFMLYTFSQINHIGTYVPAAKNIKCILLSTCIGLLTSLLCEVTQYVFMIGISDITDLMTNTLGTVIGIIMSQLMIRLYTKKNTYE